MNRKHEDTIELGVVSADTKGLPGGHPTPTAASSRSSSISPTTDRTWRVPHGTRPSACISREGASHQLVLRPGLSWCICAEQAVFADLARDRYLCLPESLERAFQRWAAGGDIGADAEQALVEAGVLEPGEGARAACAWHRPHGTTTHRSCQDRAMALHPLSGHRPAARPVLAAARTMADIVALLARERMCAPRGTQGEARSRQLVAAFVHQRHAAACRRPVPAPGDRGRRLCRRGRIDAALILGVRLDPFAAHSWVQTGDAVLVGDFENGAALHADPGAAMRPRYLLLVGFPIDSGLARYAAERTACASRVSPSAFAVLVGDACNCLEIDADSMVIGTLFHRNGPPAWWRRWAGRSGLRSCRGARGAAQVLVGRLSLPVGKG
jgi:hypothetical protein